MCIRDSLCGGPELDEGGLLDGGEDDRLGADGREMLREGGL